MNMKKRVKSIDLKCISFYKVMGFGRTWLELHVF